MLLKLAFLSQQLGEKSEQISSLSFKLAHLSQPLGERSEHTCHSFITLVQFRAVSLVSVDIIVLSLPGGTCFQTPLTIDHAITCYMSSSVKEIIWIYCPSIFS